MKVRAIIGILFVVLFACRKDNSPNVTLNGTLTNCPANYTCTYNYFDNADFTNIKLPVRGGYRVFWYNSVNASVCGTMIQFYFKTLLSSNNFDIGSGQIAEGQIVALQNDCPCCGRATLDTKPIGGEVKGRRTDATHWLINASIIFASSFNNKPVDTLVVNHYFTQQKLQ
jgi:hypothetical protein